MAFTGNEDHKITLQKAAEFTKRYRAEMAAGQVKGGFFGADAIQKILDQPGCVGIRYYYAEDDKGAQAIVLVGVDKDENDLFNGELAEVSVLCPPFCSLDNPLNS